MQQLRQFKTAHIEAIQQCQLKNDYAKAEAIA